MNDNARRYEQDNDGQSVYANQGGAQYNNDGITFANQGAGTQNNWDNNSFANYGSGTQNVILQQLERKFEGGLEALKHRQYQKVVERFEDFLSSAESVSGIPGTDMEERTAQAHVYAVLGLLNGSRPSYYSTDIIRRIETHLNLARTLGQGRPASAVADVLLAIVKEDFYDARAMRSAGSTAAELRRSLAYLDPEWIRTLTEHMASAEGETWKELADMAVNTGIASPKVFGDDEQRVIAPDRKMKVTKYFTRTPDRVSPIWHISLFSAAVLLVALAIASHNFFGLVLVVAAAWAGKKGYNRYKKYRRFQKAWAAAEPKPADQELDAWLDEDIAFIRRKGGRKLQLKAHEHFEGGDLITSAVVVVGVPERNTTRTGRPPAVRTGDDGRVRANHYDVLIVFLTPQVISSYRCILEFATGELLSDETRQYHWGNIVGVSSVSIPAPALVADLVNLPLREKSGKEPEQAKDISLLHQFTLSIVNGEKLQVTTEFGGDYFQTSGGKVAWRGNDHALSIIQSEVRSRNAQ
jgi:hypothetical protein